MLLGLEPGKSPAARSLGAGLAPGTNLGIGEGVGVGETAGVPPGFGVTVALGVAVGVGVGAAAGAVSRDSKLVNGEAASPMVSGGRAVTSNIRTRTRDPRLDKDRVFVVFLRQFTGYRGQYSVEFSEVYIVTPGISRKRQYPHNPKTAIDCFHGGGVSAPATLKPCATPSPRQQSLVLGSALN